jgi:hypothetical protein
VLHAAGVLTRRDSPAGDYERRERTSETFGVNRDFILNYFKGPRVEWRDGA